MLEGLEISEINFSKIRLNDDKLFRLEAEYFQKDYLNLEARICGWFSVSSVASSINCGPFGSNLLDTLYQNEGVLVVRPFNLKCYKVENENLVYIHEKDLSKNNLKIYLQGTIFFSRVGDIKIGILADQKKATISPNIVAVQLADLDLAKFLVTFFNTKFGFKQIRRQLKIAAQPTISTEIIAKLKFPLMSNIFLKTISQLLDVAFAKEKNSRLFYDKAESLMLHALGLKNFKSNNEKINIKFFKDSFTQAGRLDAEYYQKKYEDYYHAVSQSINGFTTISRQYKLIKKNSKRNRSYYNYIEISDINVVDGTASFNKLDAADLPANAKYEVKQGDLLISKVRPNRGAVAIIDFDNADLIVSGAFTVLRAKETSLFTSEVLKVLLRTKVYRDWMLQFNIGTQYPVIRDEDILNLPIPLIDENTQSEVKAFINQSSYLKTESERLLEVAKRGVEMAIEHDEATAMDYLTKETNNTNLTPITENS